MPRPAKLKKKRKGWVEKTKEKKPPKEEIPAQYCTDCGRKFYPREESDTCIICLTNLRFVVGANGSISQAPASKMQRPKKGKRACNGCKVEFDSDGSHNQYCDKCRKQMKNIDEFMSTATAGDISFSHD